VVPVTQDTRWKALGTLGLRQRLAPLGDRQVLGRLALTMVVFTGIYLPYTYLSAVYEPATGGHGGTLALLMLVFGVAGTIGNLAAGVLADRFGPRRVIMVAALALTAVFLAATATDRFGRLRSGCPADAGQRD